MLIEITIKMMFFAKLYNMCDYSLVVGTSFLEDVAVTCASFLFDLLTLFTPINPFRTQELAKPSRTK